MPNFTFNMVVEWDEPTCSGETYNRTSDALKEAVREAVLSCEGVLVKFSAADTQSVDEETPELTMTYHRKSGAYLIRNAVNQPIRFPSEKRIIEIWNSVFSQNHFSLGSNITRPVIGFYARIGSDTKPDNRRRFYEALAKECTS